MPVSTDYSFSSSVPAGRPAPEASFSGGDFNTFLKMLTTQITNQDPLNPMEGSDFAVQLATFSGVEQQVRTNQLIEQLASQMQTGGLSQVAQWIGKEVRSAAPVWFGDQPITLEIHPEMDADQVFLVIRDAFGRVVDRADIGPGEGQIDWFGRDATGEKIPDGRYEFEIESWRAGDLISTRGVETYSRVIGAELKGGVAILMLEGGGEVSADEISALRGYPGLTT